MTKTAVDLYPLKFGPIYKQKVWGGRAMAKLERDLPGDEDTRIGESWELADLPHTSPSGGGGAAERSLIINGPLAGATLNNLLHDYGTKFVGHLPLTEEGDFPLLVKFLDANENLSVQVHPSPAYARTKCCSGRTPCWNTSIRNSTARKVYLRTEASGIAHGRQQPTSLKETAVLCRA
jgi:mannose-6-phosphate isomerase